MQRKLPLSLLITLSVVLSQFLPVVAKPLSESTSQISSPMILGAARDIATPHLFKDDPAQTAIFKPLNGRLVYTSANHSGRDGKDTSFLVLQTTLRNTPTGGTKIEDVRQTVKSFSWTSGGDVFHPVFSPDGRYILLSVGDAGDVLGRHSLYVLDIETYAVRLISPRIISYELASWSPDGKYIAFMQGGNSAGGVIFPLFNTEEYVGPLSLWVCNWRTGEHYFVTQDDTLSGPFNWLAPDTLLYNVLAEERQTALHTNESSLDRNSTLRARPNILIYSVENQQSQLLIKDGFHPVTSPDGKWIAFYGSEYSHKVLPLRNGWQYNAQGSVLSVARSDGSERQILNRDGRTYSSIQWLSDSKRFLTIQQTKSSPNAEAEIREWDKETRRSRKITTLYARDYRKVSNPIVSPKFRPVSVTKNDTQFLVLTLELRKQGNHPAPVVIKSVQSIELNTGNITTIAQMKNTTGVAWIEVP